MDRDVPATPQSGQYATGVGRGVGAWLVLGQWHAHGEQVLLVAQPGGAGRGDQEAALSRPAGDEHEAARAQESGEAGDGGAVRREVIEPVACAARPAWCPHDQPHIRALRCPLHARPARPASAASGDARGRHPAKETGRIRNGRMGVGVEHDVTRAAVGGDQPGEHARVEPVPGRPSPTGCRPEHAAWPRRWDKHADRHPYEAGSGIGCKCLRHGGVGHVR